MAAIWALVIAHLLLLLPLLRASVEFELHGSVYPDGYFYIAMSVGEPGETYFLDVDTGSQVTWLECDFPCKSPHKGTHPMYTPRPGSQVPCEDQRCVTLHQDLDAVHDCTQKPDRCEYTIEYMEESSTGVLLTDTFSIPTSHGEIRQNLVFGCGYDQKGGQDRNIPPDGVLGLSRERGDFVSQLKQQGIITENVVGHCIDIRGGGFLFFGGDSGRVPASGVTWLPMTGRFGAYSPGEATLNLNVQLEYQVSVKPARTIFDSGSTYTYVHETTYNRLVHAVVISLQGSSLTRAYYDPTLPICWKDTEPIGSVNDVKDKFRPLDLTFGNGDNQVTLEIPPENYIIVSENGNVCLGILNGSQSGLEEVIVIGGNAMQNHIVIYDNERARIGWVRTSCQGHEPLIGSRL